MEKNSDYIRKRDGEDKLKVCVTHEVFMEVKLSETISNKKDDPVLSAWLDVYVSQFIN